MQYFLDSAKMDQIEYALENWGIDGITTNPKHIMESKKPFYQVIRDIASYTAGSDLLVSVEINPHFTQAQEMVKEGEKIASLASNFVIKLPCTNEGLIASRQLVKAGIKTNVTLVFSSSQALAAARTGAYFVSPFVGWKESSGEETNYIKEIMKIYKTYGYSSKVIVAALRNGRQIVEAALCGADIVTCGFDVFKDSFEHPFVGYGLKRFCAAWDQTDTEQGKPFED